ncbi:MAG: metallophosphoesterase, partial [Candidatus Diapherotrites archaeon]|nr:metallophosphoesterase [Candidatus Diapherotrites archaeon]
MKIGIISDTHLGFGARSEREQDSYFALRQAFEMAGQQKVDFILMPGDLFDHSIPSQECWHESFEVFRIPKTFPKSEVKVFKNFGTEKKEALFDGIPVLAIHGTHEFRGKGYKNALHVLESAKALIYFHAEAVVVEKNFEKVAIFGLGGVPEKKALDALQALNPKPVSGAKNVFVFHQSLKEFLPTDDEMSVTLSLEDLPKGYVFMKEIIEHKDSTNSYQVVIEGDPTGNRNGPRFYRWLTEDVYKKLKI